MSTPPFAARLRHLVERGSTLLLEMPPEVASVPTAPGKWSPAEIVGHLVDSASNNHQRFVRARFQDTLVFPGYEQDAWVAAQAYRDAPWAETVALWRSFNLHLARVMEATPEDQLTRPRAEHNLHRIAWKTVPEDQPTTLAYFMDDYVGHLEHHLRQILGERLGDQA